MPKQFSGTKCKNIRDGHDGNTLMRSLVRVFLPVLPQGTRNFLGTSSSDRNNGSKQLTASGRSCACCMSSLGSCDAGCRRSKQAPSVFWLRSNLERWVPSGQSKYSGCCEMLWNAVKDGTIMDHPAWSSNFISVSSVGPLFTSCHVAGGELKASRTSCRQWSHCCSLRLRSHRLCCAIS